MGFVILAMVGVVVATFPLARFLTHDGLTALRMAAFLLCPTVGTLYLYWTGEFRWPWVALLCALFTGVLSVEYARVAWCGRLPKAK